MRQGFAWLSLPLAMLWVGACAEAGACPEGQVPLDGACSLPGTIRVDCVDSVVGETSRLDWELAVSPAPIVAGAPFGANLSGVAVFNEEVLDAAQLIIPGGALRVNVVEWNATVRVYAGATGEDEPLAPDLLQYECAVDGSRCDPINDDPSSGAPGARSNSDCTPEATTNPCGQFIFLPTSTVCSPGGACDQMGKTGPGSQCARNGFCIVDDLRVKLADAVGEYTADSEGEVLFGWADHPVDEMPDYADDAGPNGLRLVFGPELVALECTMPSGAENPELISFPIETP